MHPESEAAPSAPLILLIEDDGSVRKALAFALRIEGFRLEVHASAESLLRQEPPPAAACVVFDLNLPGASGLEALQILRARGLDCPALLITTQPKPAIRAEAEALGVTILEKPLLGGALPSAIRELLSR
ncbi:response regulator [Phenylobacterium sp.]|uniref:response regulator n=1 Tax=Phenylobacterium sp. TaxID=1871053 RepID=UPI0011FFC218|nr:response regulator [Phenylobacterium sp.]THD56396.1 MAG: response regulator [Phenylobacterium sp.]